MPIAEVKIIEGRSAEAKTKLASAITDAIHEALGVPVETIRVLLIEVPPANWVIGGRPRSEAPQ